VFGRQVFGAPPPSDVRDSFRHHIVTGSDAYRGSETLTSVMPASNDDPETEAKMWKEAHAAALGDLVVPWGNADGSPAAG